jgi:hypothetical protein
VDLWCRNKGNDSSPRSGAARARAAASTVEKRAFAFFDCRSIVQSIRFNVRFNACEILAYGRLLAALLEMR